MPWYNGNMVFRNRIPSIGESFSNLTIVEIVNLNELRKGRGTGVLAKCSCGRFVGPMSLARLYGNEKTKPVESCKSCSAIIGGLKKRMLDSNRSKKLVKATYKRHAKERNIAFLLSDDEFFSKIVEPCSYCGAINVSCRAAPQEAIEYAESFPYTGLDRIDSSGAYEINNVQACCIICNRAKSDMSEAAFLKWIDRCYEFNRG